MGRHGSPIPDSGIDLYEHNSRFRKLADYEHMLGNHTALEFIKCLVHILDFLLPRFGSTPADRARHVGL